MNYLLFDDHSWISLLPLTFIRPVSEIRIGIMTIGQKWEKYLNAKCSHFTQDHLTPKFPSIIEDDNLLINGAICPNAKVIAEITSLKPNEALLKEETIVAIRLNKQQLNDLTINILQNITFIQKDFDCHQISSTFFQLKDLWEIFSKNGEELSSDYQLITQGRTSAPLSKTVNVLNPENIFVEEGATIEFATLNASGGYIYIGKDAEIMEGSLVRGPFALCEHSTLKLGTKIYGPTTVGPFSKIGGEVNNSVIFGYSNKGHDGFLGNSVIGEWCNIGADTNNSNLKNNYDEVRLWNYEKTSFVRTGLQFCGLIMGDHSKCAINTMFNTGTVVGVSANIFGSSFPRNFIPSFSWGGAAGFQVYDLQKAIETAQRVFARRNIEFNEVERILLKKVFELTTIYRRY